MGLAAPIAFGVRHGGRLRDPDRGHGAGPSQHLRRRRRVLPALAESVAMTHPTPKAEPAPRSDYRVFRTIGTRWMDNDVTAMSITSCTTAGSIRWSMATW